MASGVNNTVSRAAQLAAVAAIPLPYVVGDAYGPTPPWSEGVRVLEPDEALLWRSRPGVRRRYVDVFAPAHTEADRVAWERSVVALTETIPEIRLARVARSVDEPDVTGLIIGFDDEHGLAVYRDHPDHVPVVARMRELCAEVTRLDIVTDDPPASLPRLA